jgi:hypothetical protein
MARQDTGDNHAEEAALDRFRSGSASDPSNQSYMHKRSIIAWEHVDAPSNAAWLKMHITLERYIDILTLSFSFLLLTCTY